MQGRYDGIIGDDLDTRFRGSRLGMFIGGIGIGAVLMYLLDPDRGRGRRARLSDQLTSKANQLKEAVGSKTRHLRNRAQGLLHEVGSAVPKYGARTDAANAQSQ